MQDWKIKRMSVRTLEDWLDSVDQLRLHYLGAKGIDMPCCPLCWVECEDCLWWIIERTDCFDFKKELYPGKDDLSPSQLRNNLRFTKWKNARIKQLERWRCVIVAELAGRYVK